MSEDKTKNGADGKPDSTKPSASKTAEAQSSQATADKSAKPAQDKTAGSGVSQQAATSKAAGKNSPAKPAQTPQSGAARADAKAASPQATPAQQTSSGSASSGPASKPSNPQSSQRSATPTAAQRPPQRGSSENNAGGGSGHGRQRPAPTQNGSGGGKGGVAGLIVAVIALLIALAAAAAVAWQWYRGQSANDELSSRVSTVEQGMQSNVQKVVMPRLSDMKDRIESLSSNVEDLSGRLDDRKQQVQQLQSQVRQVQTQNTQLAGRLDGTHQRYTEQRVESLLEAANQRLNLYHDPDGAQQALQLADEAIQQAGDPRLFPVRRDIADEIASLKALPNPDIEGLSLKLANLIEQVPDLPLDTNVPSEYEDEKAAEDNGDANDANSSDDDSSNALSSIEFSRGWHHFVNSVDGALSSMVTVRRANGTQNAPALMAPDQAYFLTQNLQLQLRSAQLALLTRNTQAYHESLSSARDWIKRYFDTNQSSVQAALDAFNELSNVKLDWQAPDISNGLSRLRGIMSRSDGDTSDDSSTSSDQASDSDNDNSGSEQ